MNDIPQNVLDRIRKCLALAASPNPGEAETAMQHARKLMEKYGIEKSDLELSEIGETELVAIKGHMKSLWMFRLFELVDNLLGTTSYLQTYGNVKSSGYICFIGPKPKLELVKYLFSVLLRQLTRDRRNYLKSLRDDFDLWLKTFTYSRGRKGALADAFCLEWLDAVEKRLKHLFMASPAILETYKKKNHPDLGTTTSKSLSFYGLSAESLSNAQARGKECGENADVFLAMGKHPDAESLGLDQLKLTHG